MKLPAAPALLPDLPPTRPDPTDLGGRRYLRSYLLMRLVIGLLGIALPVVLVLGDLLLTGAVPWRGSLSAYYYSGGGDVFVGVMVATGLFLLSYRAFERTWENVLSGLAGVAAVGVALFPTDGGDRLTPLQDQLGEGTVAAVHYTCAGIFIGSLAVISLIFGRREELRTDPDAPPTRRTFWRNTHYLLAGCVAAAVLVIVLGLVGPASLFVGEVVAVVAFGLSWLLKGAELRKVHLPRAGRVPAAVDRDDRVVGPVAGPVAAVAGPGGPADPSGSGPAGVPAQQGEPQASR